ncbi:unnamed protein product [Cunninghamella blakesleeana]
MVTFFKTMHKQSSNKDTRDGVVEIILQEFKEQETIHYEQLESLSPKEIEARTENFIESINSTKNAKVFNDIDCLVYFNSQTIKGLNILSDQECYNRRFIKIRNAITTLQYKDLVIDEPVPIKLNYVIHHYILCAMNIKNEILDYPIIPLAKLNTFDRMFRSYVEIEKVKPLLIVDVMIDFFINEVQHNYDFWILLINRCKDLAENKTNDNFKTSYLEISRLLGLKFRFLHENNHSIPTELFYVAALLIKEEVASLTGLLPYIVNTKNQNTNVNTENNNNQTHLVNINNDTQSNQFYNNSLLFAMALISIGATTEAIKILQQDSMIKSESFLLWMNELLNKIIDTVYNTRVTRVTKTKSSSLPNSPIIVNNQHSIYLDSDEESESENSDVFSDVTYKSNNSIKSNNDFNKDGLEHSNMMSVFAPSFNMAHTNFFYTEKRDIIHQCDSLNSFASVITPIIEFLDIDKVDTTLINKIIDILISFTGKSIKLRRTDYSLFMNKIIFPALVNDPSIDFFKFISKLDGQQRLDIYQLWQKSIDTKSGKLRDQCNIALQSTKELLTQALSPSSNPTACTKTGVIIKSIQNIASKHPTEVANYIINKVITPILNNPIATSHHHLRIIADIYRGSNALAWDVFISLLADKAVSMTGHYWSETTTYLPKENDKENTTPGEAYDLKLPKKINYLTILSDSIVRKSNHNSNLLREYLICFFNDDSHSIQYPCLRKLPSFYKENFIESMCPSKLNLTTPTKRNAQQALENDSRKRIR